MKKYILLIVLFLNILPMFKNGKFSVTSLNVVIAQGESMGNEGEPIDNLATCYDYTNTTLISSYQNSNGITINVYMDEIFYTYCTTGYFAEVLTQYYEVPVTTICETTDRTLVSEGLTSSVYEVCKSTFDCVTNNPITTNECTYEIVRNYINPSLDGSGSGDSGGGSGSGNSSVPPTYPSSGTLTLTSTTALGGININIPENKFTATNGNWELSTMVNPLTGGMPDLLKVHINFTLNTPVNANEASQGNVFGPNVIPTYVFNLVLRFNDGTLIQSFPLISGTMPWVPTLQVNQTFTIPATGTNYTISSWHNKTVSMTLEGQIYSGNPNDINSIKAVMGDNSWKGLVPQ